MTRDKTHLIAVNKCDNKEAIIMRDVRDAMQCLVIIMSHHHSITDHSIDSTTYSKNAFHRNLPAATHHHYNNAKVTPFSQYGAHN